MPTYNCTHHFLMCNILVYVYCLQDYLHIHTCKIRAGWAVFSPGANSVQHTLTLSADPCLSQGKGGAWDHRRCGTFFPFPTMLCTFHEPLKPQQCLCTSHDCTSHDRQVSEDSGLSQCSALSMSHSSHSNEPLKGLKPLHLTRSQGTSTAKKQRQRLFMGVQACRLAALKPLKTHKTHKTPKNP